MHNLKLGLWTLEDGRGQQILLSKANYKTIQNCQSKSPKNFKTLETNQRQTTKRSPLFYEKLLEVQLKAVISSGLLAWGYFHLSFLPA